VILPSDAPNALSAVYGLAGRASTSTPINLPILTSLDHSPEKGSAMRQQEAALRIARRPNVPTIQPEAATPIEPLLTPADLARILGVSKRMIERMRSASRFPAPIYIGRLPRWEPSVIREFVARGGQSS
jgi:predicted DNA-binding transcriptional regulator AlpA